MHTDFIRKGYAAALSNQDLRPPPTDATPAANRQITPIKPLDHSPAPTHDEAARGRCRGVCSVLLLVRGQPNRHSATCLPEWRRSRRDRPRAAEFCFGPSISRKLLARLRGFRALEGATPAPASALPVSNRGAARAAEQAAAGPQSRPASRPPVSTPALSRATGSPGACCWTTAAPAEQAVLMCRSRRTAAPGAAG
jgi:hypothetical protein